MLENTKNMYLIHVRDVQKKCLFVTLLFYLSFLIHIQYYSSIFEILQILIFTKWKRYWCLWKSFTIYFMSYQWVLKKIILEEISLLKIAKDDISPVKSLKFVQIKYYLSSISWFLCERSLKKLFCSDLTHCATIQPQIWRLNFHKKKTVKYTT